MDMAWAMAARRSASAPAGNDAIPGRYAAPRVRPFSLAAAVAIGGGLVSAVAWLGADRPHVSRIERRLVVMSLMAPPPPPPATPAEAAPVRTAAITAPPPLVASPTLPTLSAAMVVPEPTPPTVEESQPAPDAVRPAAPPAPAAPAAATDLSATMIAARPPSYPTLSRRNREQGIVTLAVRLSLDGQVDAISIARSSGFERLDKAALAAVKHWRWSPTMREGRAVAVAGLVRMPFVLRT